MSDAQRAEFERMWENGIPAEEVRERLRLRIDADVLRRAAVILRAHSRKPRGWWLTVLCRVLVLTADKYDAEAKT